jgi:hypothetical protein
MEPRTYKITLRSHVGGGKEKHVVDDLKVARFLLDNCDRRTSECPVLQRLTILSQQEDDIDLLSLRIAQLKEERLSFVTSIERCHATSALIAKIRIRIAHSKVLSNLALSIGRSYLEDPTVKSFLVNYDKSPTGDIATAFEAYLRERVRKSLRDIY